MKNIVYICKYAADYAGNFMTCIYQLSKIAKKNGYDIYFILPKEAKNKEWIKIVNNISDEVFFMEFNYKSVRKSIRTIKQNFNEETIIHTHFLDYKDIFAIKQEVDFLKSKIVFHQHMHVNLNKNNIKNKIKKLISRYVFRNVRFIGVSDAVSSDLRVAFPKEIVYTVINAIDFERLENIEQNYEIQVDKNYFNILIFGTHYHRKGVDIAIKAIGKLLNKSDMNIKLYIITHDIEITRKIILDEFGEVEFLKFVNPMEEISVLYNELDVFISPSRSEAFGYAVVEASYCRCQVIASDTKGQDTMKGIPYVEWVKVEDEKDLMNKIEVCYIKSMNKGILENQNIEQIKVVKSMFSLDKWCDSIMYIYNE